MEVDSSGGSYAVKGAKTILGKVFAYQKETGMSIKDIMKLPYIMFVIGMLDAPSIDYENGKVKKEKVNVPETAEQEINAMLRALK